VSERPEALDVEALLADALRPIEPPDRFSTRVESTLATLTEHAANELSWWADEFSDTELQSLRDPRNWIRPVTALAAGGVATGALILVGFRRRSRFRG
jgi:hypothetical protein